VIGYGRGGRDGGNERRQRRGSCEKKASCLDFTTTSIRFYNARLQQPRYDSRRVHLESKQSMCSPSFFVARWHILSLGPSNRTASATFPLSFLSLLPPNPHPPIRYDTHTRAPKTPHHLSISSTYLQLILLPGKNSALGPCKRHDPHPQIITDGHMQVVHGVG